MKKVIISICLVCILLNYLYIISFSMNTKTIKNSNEKIAFTSGFSTISNATYSSIKINENISNRQVDSNNGSKKGSISNELQFKNNNEISVIEDLENIAEYNSVVDDAFIEKLDKETNSLLLDLLNEMKPYLKNELNIYVDENNKNSSKEVLSIIVRHPIKFLLAIYNYTINTLKETLAIAKDNADVVEK